jgi:serine/threonine-protein kinase
MSGDDGETWDTQRTLDEGVAPLPQLDPLQLPERYRSVRMLAEGGFGQVWQVHDTHLQRTVACKVTHFGVARTHTLRARFEAEARLTGRLQHPGVVPVHDLGTLPDGRLWFTMREVRGQTLGQVLRGVHLASDSGWGTTEQGWSLRRLIQALVTVSEVVAYAHSQDVVHRDLKPSNVMVGAFGQVLVMDWGISKVLDGLEDTQGAPMGGRPGLTQAGALLGTPSYMSPEQAAGDPDAHGPWTDVFALGALLYACLRGRPPYVGDADTAWRRAQAAEYTPLGEGPPVPSELQELLQVTLVAEPGARGTAAGFSQALQAWLDGSAKRARARRILEETRPLADQAAGFRVQAAGLRLQAGHVLDGLKPWSPVADKQPGWDLEDQARALEDQAEVAETRFAEGLRRALREDPELTQATDLLADTYRAQLEQAEQRGDARAQLQARSLLEATDTAGRHTAWLSGMGAVSLVTDPPGAEVFLERYEVIQRRLQPVPVRSLGTTPLDRVPLPRGSYRLRIRKPGFDETLYPVQIGRGEHWDGVPPEGGAPTAIRLLPQGTLGEDWCYVPAGWFTAGGDDDAIDGLPSTRVWMEGFLIATHPVTWADYLAYLNRLVDAHGPAAALKRAPRYPATERGPGALAVQLDPETGRPTGLEQRWQDAGGPTLPVVLIDWNDARALASDTRSPAGSARLLFDLEWEKAARGADGRAFPWGNELDATWTCMKLSHPGRPVPGTVDAFPGDVGVYGVRHLGGSVRELCANGYQRTHPEGRLPRPVATPDAPWRMLRGGSWLSTEDGCRGASRFVQRPPDRTSSNGVRLGADLPLS